MQYNHISNLLNQIETHTCDIRNVITENKKTDDNNIKVIEDLTQKIQFMKQNQEELTSVSAIVGAKNNIIRLENENLLLKKKILFLQNEISTMKECNKKCTEKTTSHHSVSNDELVSNDEPVSDEEELDLYEYTWNNLTYYLDDNDNIYEKLQDESVGEQIGTLTLSNHVKKPKWI